MNLYTCITNTPLQVWANIEHQYINVAICFVLNNKRLPKHYVSIQGILHCNVRLLLLANRSSASILFDSYDYPSGADGLAKDVP